MSLAYIAQRSRVRNLEGIRDVQFLVGQIDHIIMIVPIRIGSPIILSILKGLKFRIDLSAIGRAAAFLSIIIPDTVKIKPWKHGKTGISAKRAVQGKTLGFEGTLVQIFQGCRQRLAVEKFLAASRCY